ncbi:hypothetical protein J6590_091215 [Homalodisca vitripennis]|nr:hypothetical protein J6590_091215 [Homalodisca vitripennis]
MLAEESDGSKRFTRDKIQQSPETQSIAFQLNFQTIPCSRAYYYTRVPMER